MNVPMPTLPSGMIAMRPASSVDPSGVVAKATAGALRRVGPVLRRELPCPPLDVAEVGRAVAGRTEDAKRVAQPGRRLEPLPCPRASRATNCGSALVADSRRVDIGITAGP